MKTIKPIPKGKEELKPEADAPDSSSKPPNRGNVDQIRDILFGAQMEEYEKKFASLEEHLLRESASLREEILRQFQTLEQHLLRESQSLKNDLLAEKEGRNKSADELLSKIKDDEINFQKKIGVINSQSVKNREEFQGQLNQQLKLLQSSILQEKEGLENQLEEQIKELRESKADRALLASKLTELATELNHGDKSRPPKVKNK